jgi:hypothetical protein
MITRLETLKRQGLKKERNFFLKKLAGLKRSCSFAPALRDKRR